MAIPLPHHRFTVDEFERMFAVGILIGDAHVELIAGEIFDPPPRSPPHDISVGLLRASLRDQRREEAFVTVRHPLRLSDSVVLPDIAICESGTERDMPLNPTDVLLIIEVADSDADAERDTRLSLYGAANIPEAWIVALSDGHIERNIHPKRGITGSDTCVSVANRSPLP